MVKFCPIARYRQRAIDFLGPTIRQRLALKATGDSDQEPDDLIQWLLNAAPPEERNVEMLTERVMALNVASIHTTTMVSEGQHHRILHSTDMFVELHLRTL